MSSPRLYIDLKKIKNNVQTMVKLCGKYNIEITGISKVFCARPEIVQAYLEGGIKRIGDSRIENLMNIAELPCEKWLIRTPQLSRADETVKYADVTLNSELKVLEALNAAAKKQNIMHKVVLMYDLGDLREGFINENEFAEAAEFVKNSSNLELYGTGNNMTCFSFVHPDSDKLSQLVSIAKKYGEEAGTKLLFPMMLMIWIIVAVIMIPSMMTF